VCVLVCVDARYTNQKPAARNLIQAFQPQEMPSA